MCRERGWSDRESLRPTVARGVLESAWANPRFVQPQSLWYFSRFSADTEWAEMDDYDEVSGSLLVREMPAGQNHSRAAASGLYAYNTAAATQAKAWFDVRVIYVRVSGCPLEDAPEFLSMRFPARSIGTALEVNGARIAPSEEATLVLRRDRVDTESAEATYVGTDNLRTSGTISYDVYNKDESLVSGTLEQAEHSADAKAYNGYDSVSTISKRNTLAWKMECSSSVGQSGCVFLKQRHEYSTVSLSLPALEVCVVGRFSGTPMILTETVQLTARRRSNRQTTLDAIPEAEEVGRSQYSLMTVDQPGLVTEGSTFMDLTDKAAAAGLGYALEGSGYGEGDDGQMSWFNAGVRVGVGIGLGMCLGVGIGVGLIVRTYQATTKTFRRGFL